MAAQSDPKSGSDAELFRRIEEAEKQLDRLLQQPIPGGEKTPAQRPEEDALEAALRRKNEHKADLYAQQLADLLQDPHSTAHCGANAFHESSQAKKPAVTDETIQFTLPDTPESSAAPKQAPAEPVREMPAAKPAGKRRWPKITAIVLACLLALYGLVVWAPIRPIERLRNIYIETALSTMSHRWLATAFFPKSVIDEVRHQMNAAVEEQEDLESQWEGRPEAPVVPDSPDAPADPIPPSLPADDSKAAREAFFALFRELDPEETLRWTEKHPEVLANGWGNLRVNRSGLNEDGLPLHTTRGDQVLAIDARNQILLIRVKGTGWRGVLAIAKDPSRLSLQAASTIGEMGQNAGRIAEEHGGLLAMTASGFQDPEGHGKGGEVTGFARCNGADYGEHLRGGYRRFEKHRDQRFYLTKAVGPVSEEATDAMEFTPALIVDGKLAVNDRSGWTALNPRACLGQSADGAIHMLVIEGRLPTVSLGIGVYTCARLLQDYGCVQAMNMDGGTSAILWYDGAYVTKCSNTALEAGRRLPNAWVYS